MKKTRVLAIHSGKRNEAGACEIYRVITPMYYLNQRPGWLADWISFTQLHQAYLKRQEEGDAFFDELMEAYDVFIFARICIAQNEDAYESAKYLINKMRETGKRVLYEVDDDYTNTYRHVANGDAITLASWCDAITVTTPYLADTMRRFTNRPCYILPNMLDPRFWKNDKQVKLSEGKIRIVLSGSTTHAEDWKVLEGVLQRIAEKYENVRVLLGAFHPTYLQDVNHVELVPPLEYPKYVELIKNADIVLAPVLPTDKFNLGKSPIKAVEGMGATRIIDGIPHGAAVIATDNEVYRLAITNGVDGILIPHTEEAWYDALEKLIENEAMRKSMQLEAHKTAWKRFDIQEGSLSWGQAYAKVLSKPGNTQELKYGSETTPIRKLTRMPDAITRRPEFIRNPLLSENLPHPV